MKGIINTFGDNEAISTVGLGRDSYGNILNGDNGSELFLDDDGNTVENTGITRFDFVKKVIMNMKDKKTGGFPKNKFLFVDISLRKKDFINLCSKANERFEQTKNGRAFFKKSIINTIFHGIDKYQASSNNVKVGYAYVTGNTADEMIKNLDSPKIYLSSWAKSMLEDEGKLTNNIVSQGIENLERIKGLGNDISNENIESLLNSMPSRSGEYNKNEGFLLKKICDYFFARAYITLSPNDLSIMNGNFNDSFTILNNVIGTKKSNNSKQEGEYTVIDCDIDPDIKSKLKDDINRKDLTGDFVVKKIVNELLKNNIRILYKGLSNTGVHIVIYTEDVIRYNKEHKNKDAFNEFLKNVDDRITITNNRKKNDKTKEFWEFSNNNMNDNPVSQSSKKDFLLYSPCGRDSDISIIKNYIRFSNIIDKLCGKKAQVLRNKLTNSEKEEMLEEQYKKLVKEIAYRCLNEVIKKYVIREFSTDDVKSNIGSSGPIKESDLIDSREIVKDSYEKYLPLISKLKRQGQKRDIDFERLFKDDPAYLIWKQYVSSMVGTIEMIPKTDNRGGVLKHKGKDIMEPRLNGFLPKDKNKEYPKTALPFWMWLENMAEGQNSVFGFGDKTFLKAFKYGDSYLFGYFERGVFIANSFAGKGGMENLRLLKEISKYDNIVFAVTLDIGKMLEKLGFYTDGNVHETTFGGRTVLKKTYATSENLLDTADKMEKMRDLATMTRKSKHDNESSYSHKKRF